MIRLGKFVHIQCKRRIQFLRPILRLLEMEKELLFNPQPVLSQLMFNSTHLLTKPSTSLLMRHTQMDRQKQTHLVNTQAHVPTHTNRHLSLLEVRGIKGLFVVLAPAPCSQSISPFRRSLSSRTATLAMIE